MRNKLFEISDIYHAGHWMFSRFAYQMLPVNFYLKYARLKGRLKFYLSNQQDLIKKNLMKFLGNIYSEEQIDSIAPRHFEFCEKMTIAHKLINLDRFTPPANWPVQGSAHLDKALSRGKGVILVSAHFGYYKLIKNILINKGYNVKLVRASVSKNTKRDQKTIKNASRFKQYLYKRFYTPLALPDENDLFANFNIRPLMEVLKKNGVLVIMGDALHSSQFVYLPFLGQTYPFPQGYMSLAMMTDAAILPAFVLNADNGSTLKLVIESPLALQKKGANGNGLQHNIEQYVSVYESYVKRHPDQLKIWLKEDWFEKRLARSKKSIKKRY